MSLFKKHREAGQRRASVSKSHRIYAIGDVHGRNDLLVELIDRIYSDAEARADHRKTLLVVLGDVIDRGDASRQTLDTLQRLMRDREIVFLKGNHEDAMLDFLEDPIAGASWMSFGGQQTLASFGIFVPSRRLEDRDLIGIHEEFIAAVQPYLGVFQDAEESFMSGDMFFSHAGVNPAKALDRQSRRALLWGHPDGQSDIPVPGKKVVHGHFDDLRVVNLPGRLCVDTGAYYSGILTAACLDSEEAFLQTGT